MELTTWIDTLLVEFPVLWHCLRDNRYPSSFLANALGLSPDLCEHLPQHLIYFVGIYFLCGVITLTLHFRKGQKSLTSRAHQFSNAILVCCSTLFVPALVYLAKACVYVLQNEVAPLQGQGDYIRYFGEAISSVYYIILAFAAVLFTVWMPVHSLLRYGKVYRIQGVPHGIFDLGFGLFLIAVILLSCAYSNRRLYSLLLPPIVILSIVQADGYIPEEENLQQPKQTTSGQGKPQK